MFRHIPVLSEISLQLIFTPAPHSSVCWQTWNDELCTLNCHSELQTILFAQHKQWSGTHVRCQELFKWSKFWYLNEIYKFCTHCTIILYTLLSDPSHDDPDQHMCTCQNINKYTPDTCTRHGTCLQRTFQFIRSSSLIESHILLPMTSLWSNLITNDCRNLASSLSSTRY